MKDLPPSPHQALSRHLEHFPSGSDIELQVLKGHLLLEKLLRELLAAYLRKPEVINGSRLNFAQVLALVEALSPQADAEPWIWEIAKQLNSVRNLLAHELSPQELARKVAVLTATAHQRNPTIEEDRIQLGIRAGNDFELVLISMCTYLSALLSIAKGEVTHAPPAA